MTKGSFFTAEWFPYNVDRFEKSDKVALMNCTEEGAYHRAIRFVWKNRSISADVSVFAARFRCSAKVAAKVMKTFVADPDDSKRLIHPIVEEIRAEQEQKYLRRRKGGQASAESRKLSVENKDTSNNTEQCLNNTPTRIENREEENTKSVCVRAGGRVPESVSDEERQLTETVLDHIRTVKNANILPKESEWIDLCGFAHRNKRSAAEVIETYSLLHKQKWRKGNVTAAVVTDNLLNLDRLRAEIADQDKPQNGTNRTNNFGNRRRTDADVIAESTEFYDNYPA